MDEFDLKTIREELVQALNRKFDDSLGIAVMVRGMLRGEVLHPP